MERMPVHAPAIRLLGRLALLTIAVLLGAAPVEAGNGSSATAFLEADCGLSSYTWNNFHNAVTVEFIVEDLTSNTVLTDITDSAGLNGTESFDFFVSPGVVTGHTYQASGVLYDKNGRTIRHSQDSTSAVASGCV